MRTRNTRFHCVLLTGVAAASSVFALTGCEGTIGPVGVGPDMMPGSGNGGTSATGGSAGAGNGMPAPGELSTPYTRLTRAEYRATLDAAFSIDAAVSGIPDDGRIGPFTSNVLTADPAHELLLASEDLAAQIVPSLLPACSGASASKCISTSYRPSLERVYRRALSDAEVQELATVVTTLEGSGVSAEAATRAMLVSALMSADFLFRATPLSGESARGRRLAEHLSYALWDAPPDADLVNATQQDPAQLPSRLKEQAMRLGTDPRAVPVLARFLAQWLHVDVDSKLSDSGADFASSPLYAELIAFTRNALATGLPVKAFVNGTQGFVQQGNFAAYGIPPASGEGVLPVSWLGSTRRGLLSEELFMDATRHPDPTRRPIFRGHLVRSALLCEVLAPPPPNVVDLDSVVSDRTMDARCAGCHQLMDPIGKAFASLDLDNSGPVPAPVVNGSGEVSGAYPDLVAMLDAIAESQTYADCFSRNLLGFFLEQEPVLVDAAAVSDVAVVVRGGGSLADAVAQVSVTLEQRSSTTVPWCSGQ